MNLQKENITRKIDSSGRVSIPRGIVQRLALSAGEELEFFTFQENDVNYVAFCRVCDLVKATDEIAITINVLEKYGLEVPEKLTSLSGGKT